jgi:hypothetical protein
MKRLAGPMSGALWVLFSYTARLCAAEPILQSVHPLAGPPGATYQATIAGANLAGLHSLTVDEPGVRARLLSATADQLNIEITLDPSVPSGEKKLRAIGPQGITNAISWHVVAEPTALAKPDLTLAPPLVVNGVLREPGEVHTFTLKTQAGEALTFEAVSASPAFDPVLTLLEPAQESWFSPKSWKRLAFHDEDLFFPGLSTQPRLTHLFATAGPYRLQISGFSGHGGPAASYYLRVRPGTAPPPPRHPLPPPDWTPRSFVRQLGPDWLSQLYRRGGDQKTQPPPPTRIAASAKAPPSLSIPGIFEGRIDQPAQVRKASLYLEQSLQLALEIETPEATLPEFNPVVTVFDSTGREVATNVHTKRNNNGLYMMKMIHPRTTFLLTPGDYTLQVRNITTDHGRPDFAFRVLLRPQIAHAGRVTLPDDRLNLTPGAARVLTFQLDREEDFRDPVAATLTGLPPGVSVLPVADNPVERPPLPNAGRIERYTPKPQTFSLLLQVAEGTPLSAVPVYPKLTVRPVRQGRLAAPLLEKPIPLMIVAPTP